MYLFLGTSVRKRESRKVTVKPQIHTSIRVSSGSSGGSKAMPLLRGLVLGSGEQSQPSPCAPAPALACRPPKVQPGLTGLDEPTAREHRSQRFS